MKYCLDTSALIDLGERFYPEHIPVFAPIWEHIYTGIEQENILLVDYVKIELEKQAGEWRDRFIAQNSKAFVMNESIEKNYSQVIKDIEANPIFNHNKSRTRFMVGADPWVIALAITLGEATVVSAETKNLANYGLGEVSKHLGVRHISLVEFFAENNIGR